MQQPDEINNPWNSGNIWFRTAHMLLRQYVNRSKWTGTKEAARARKSLQAAQQFTTIQSLLTTPKLQIMATLNDKESRDFVQQVIVLVNQNASLLTAAGFDPTTRSGQLQTELQTADEAEGAQQNAQAAALDATKVAQETLKVAYEDASAVINLIEGLLGKDHGLVRQLRQLRA